MILTRKFIVYFRDTNDQILPQTMLICCHENDQKKKPCLPNQAATQCSIPAQTSKSTSIDVLFPLVGWLIEGFEETPLTI